MQNVPIAAISDIGQTQVGKSISLSAEVNGKSDAYSYAWNFGDGSTAAGVTVSHTYTAAGNYTLSLTVHGTKGSRQIEKTVSVVTKTTVYFNLYAAYPSNGSPPSNPQVVLPSVANSPGVGITATTAPNTTTPAPSSSTPGIAVGWLIGLGLLIVLVVIGVVLLIFRRKPEV